MADFPDTSFEQMPLPAKRRIDAACARFEEAWRGGGRAPRVESYFDDAPGEEHAVLLAELLLLDVEYRRRQGELPRASDYLTRFPGHESVIRTVLPATGKSDTGGGDQGQTIRSVLAPARRPSEVPGYELLEELGRGGMGVVYKARHVALNRMVALKFILAGTSAPARHIERFRREAEVVARLRHPNIVQIYDIGEVNNQAFLALEYAEGGSLRDRLAGQPLEPRAAALILEPCARAVQHAHRQGVVHRDLKPANILMAVGGDSVASGNRPLPGYRPTGFDLPGMATYQPPLATCTPKITDFGLARMLDARQSGSELGVAAGTPQYMAPEQATGDPDAGPLIDVWALGATLYELLTGRPPFRAASARETMRLIVDADPVPPTQLQPTVPRDLETICLKCLEKEPQRRYPGARELAQDLRRFLDGEPIHARRLGAVERLRKWARRRPYRALGALALVTAAVCGLIAGVGSLLRAHRGWSDATRGAEDAEQRARRADDEAQRALGEQAASERALRRAQVEAARLLLEQAGTQGALGAPDRAVHDLLTGVPLSGDEPSLTRLLRANLAGWLPYVHRVEQVVPLPPDTRCAALSPDGTLLAGGRDGMVRRRAVTGQPKGSDWKQGESIRFLSLSRDGSRVLVGEPSRVVVRDVASGEEVGRTARHPRRVTDAVFTADGRGFFTACEDGVVRRWEASGQRVGGDLAHPIPPRRLAVSPDGRSLAVALAEGDAGSAWLWRVEGDPVQTHALPHPAGVWAVAFHPGGERLFTGCSDGRAREWDIASAKEAGPAFDHGGEVVQADVTPDGRTLLTVSREDVARLWEVPTRQPVGVFTGALTGTRLSGDGTRVVALLPGAARLHRLARPLSRLEGLTPREALSAAVVTSVTVFPGGKRVLYVQPRADTSRGLIWARDVPAGAEVQAPWEQAFRDVTCVALDPAGKVAAVASRRDGAGAVQLWDAVTGQPIRQPWRLPVPAASLAFAPDGQELAAGDERGGVRRWVTATGEALPPLNVGPGVVAALAYRPLGKGLAVAVAPPEEAGRVCVWDLETSNPGPVRAHPGRPAALEFGPDGQALLVIGRTTRLWQLDQPNSEPLEVRRVTAARFAAGGQAVLIGTGDGHLKRYDARGQSAGAAVPHPGAVLSADLSADGKTLLVAGREGTLRLWDLEGAPRPLGPPLVANRPVLAARFAGDGRSCVSVADDGDVRAWPAVRGENGSVEELKRRVLVWTGREIDPAGLLAPLSADRWSVARANHAADPLGLDEGPAAAAAAWHDARARDARQDGDLFGERWHLDRLLALWPADRSVHRRRAVVLARLGEYAAAAADLKAAGPGDPKAELAWAAAACAAVGDREAERWFRSQGG